MLFAGLFVCLCATFAVGQSVVEQLPAVEEPALVPPVPSESTPIPLDSTPVPLESVPLGEPEPLYEPSPVDEVVTVTDEPVVEPVDEPVCQIGLHDFWGYRYSTHSTSWIVGHGDQFGMTSLMTDHYQSRGEDRGLGLGLNFHFLAGPERTDMPPHLFDFSLALQRRVWKGNFGYDVAASIMASTDFEGSSRRGIRYPAHAVGYLRVLPAWQLVFGVDYLDRRDVMLLPVGGVIWLPHPDMRFELVFPRPRIVLQLTDTDRLTIGGDLGGGTWAIERADYTDDLVTYRDLRLTVGLEDVDEDGDWSAIEISYIFDRKLEYESGIGDYYPRETVMISLTTKY